MRMARGTVGVACALLVCATIVACGDDSGSSDSGGGSSASDNAITVKASEYKFDISGQLTAGYAQITLENDGKEPHELIPLKLKDGKTAADALPILEAEGEPDPAALAEVFDGDPTTSFYGTPGARWRPPTTRRPSRTSPRAATCSSASSRRRTASRTCRSECSLRSRSARATTRLHPRPRARSRSQTTASRSPMV